MLSAVRVIRCWPSRALSAGLLLFALEALPASIVKADAQALVPSLASASVVAPDEAERPLCPSRDCVLRRVGPASTVRLTGGFGRFAGRVTRWDADSLAGFAVDPEWGGSVPAAPIGWSQIATIDKRVDNSLRGACIGGIGLGALTALFAATVTAVGDASLFVSSDRSEHEIARAALSGALIGGAVGAAIGAGIGSGSHHWILLYRTSDMAGH